MEITFPQQTETSVLFITLDSCRYDTFVQAQTPNLKAIGPVYRAMAPGNFTYGSHVAMFVGFTPGVANQFEPYVNPKYGKIFRMEGGAAFPGKSAEHISLRGRNIIDGFKAQGYLTLGTGAAGWFNPDTSTGKALIEDFDQFYYPGNTYSLDKQLQWLAKQLKNSSGPHFVFLNVGETHVPYYYPHAPWSWEDNPCIPFATNNRREDCQKRQKACLEYVDHLLSPLLDVFKMGTIFICADHGDCWGEDGLWEHGFYHEKVLEVPLIFKLRANPSS